jgi:DnaK suppressor protein
LAKSSKVGKRPAPAAKTSTKQSAKPARPAAAKVNHKPAKPNKSAPKAAAKPAPKPVRRTAAPAPTAAPATKSAPTPKAAPAPKAAKKPARPAAVVAQLPIVSTPAVLAPSKFRREYKRWKDLLISLRHRLLQEGSHLEEEGLKALEQEVSVDHMADFGSDSSEQETTLQLIESNSLSMRDVDDALKRIEAGTYGLCEDCEQLIPAARLAVLPHARFCIGCQSKREGMPA